jgi:hypothetical protein
MRHRRRYSTPLDVTSERKALTELALFERDPAAYVTRRADVDSAAPAVFIDRENERFLCSLEPATGAEAARIS